MRSSAAAVVTIAGKSLIRRGSLRRGRHAMGRRQSEADLPKR